MWRRAQGRLVAIAVVAAGNLSSCATSPKPVAADEHEEPYRHMSCGDSIARERSPENLREEIAEEVKGATWRCGLNLSDQRYGEVRVSWNRQDGVSVDTTQTHGLSEEDRRCIEEAARTAIRPDDVKRGRSPADWARDFPDGLTIYTSFGTPPPLLPPLPELAAEWQAATASPASRERLLAKLPAEAVLEDDGCVSFPGRPAFTDRLQRWLETAGAPVDGFWGRSHLRDGLFADRGVNGQPDAGAYVLSGKAVIVKRRPWPPRPHWAPVAAPEVCLQAWDRKLERELRARIDQRASCMTGDLAEILVHPRADVPTGRRFASVAVGPTRVCALDDGGRLACCGERTQQDIPSVAFASVAVGANFDCGVTVAGDLYCWGRESPAYGTLIKGPFAQVAVAAVEVATLHVCAIRRDTRALECWDPSEGRMVTATREKVRSAVVDAWGACVLLEAGPVLCRDARPGEKWRELHGSLRTLAADEFGACGLNNEGGAIACRERWPERSPGPIPTLPRPTVVEGPIEVALSGQDGCVLDRSGRVTCWPQARNRFGERYRMIAASANRLCALTLDGKVECDRDWPSLKPVGPAL